MPVVELKVGDIVWARVPPLPFWPGQVMDAEVLGNRKIARKPTDGNCLLISFFGDSTYNWVDHINIEDFATHAEKQKQNVKAQLAKSFKTACEEAQEVLDVRAGLTPATNHEPIDFLRPSTWPEEMLNPEQEEKVNLPNPPTPEDVGACSALDILSWYRDLVDTLRVPLTHAPLDHPAPRLLFSLVAYHASQEQARLDPAPPLAASPPAPPEPAADKHKKRLKRADDASGSGGDAAIRKRPRKSVQTGPPRVFPPEPGSTDDDDYNTDEEEERPLADLKAAGGPGKAKAARSVEAEQLYRFGGCLKEEVLVDVPGFLKSLAADVGAQVGQEVAQAAAAVLRWREAAHARSSLAREGDIGMVTRLALEGCGVMPKVGGAEELDLTEERWVKTRGGKKVAALGAPSASGELMGQPSGEVPLVPVLGEEASLPAEAELEAALEGALEAGALALVKKEGSKKRRKGGTSGGGSGAGGEAGTPGEEDGQIVEVKVKEYMDLVGTREEFEEKLKRFARERGLVKVPYPVIHGHMFDNWFVFKEVAGHGGYEAVSALRLWRRVALAWKPDLELMMTTSTPVLRAYKQLLADYEDSITQNVPYKTITARRWGARRCKSFANPTPPKAPRIPGSAAKEAAAKRLEQRRLMEARQQAAEVAAIAAPDLSAAAAAAAAAAASAAMVALPPPRPKLEAAPPRRAAHEDRALAAFDDLMDADSGAKATAAARAAGGPSAASDGGSGGGGASLGNRDYRRVLLKFPEKSQLPPKNQVMSFARSQFNYIEYDDVELFPLRAALHITYRQHEEAEAARAMWGQKAHLMFSFPNGSIQVSLVRATTTTIKKRSDAPSLPGRLHPARDSGRHNGQPDRLTSPPSLTGVPPAHSGGAADPRRAPHVMDGLPYGGPGGYTATNSYNPPALGAPPLDPRRAANLSGVPPAAAPYGQAAAVPRPMTTVNQIPGYSDAWQTQQQQQQQAGVRYQIPPPLRPTAMLPTLVAMPIPHQAAALYSTSQGVTHVAAAPGHATLLPQLQQPQLATTAPATYLHQGAAAQAPQRTPTTADPFAGVDFGAIHAAITQLQSQSAAQQAAGVPQGHGVPGGAQGGLPAASMGVPAGGQGADGQAGVQRPPTGDEAIKADILKLLDGFNPEAA